MPQIGADGTLLMLSPLLLVTWITAIHASAHPVVHTEPTIDATVTRQPPTRWGIAPALLSHKLDP